MAVSTTDEMALGTQFLRLIPGVFLMSWGIIMYLNHIETKKIPFCFLSDSGKLVAAQNVRRVVFCSGKVYYDLAAFRDANKITVSIKTWY